MAKVVLNEQNRIATIPLGLVAIRAFVGADPRAVAVVVTRDGAPIPPPPIQPPPGTVLVSVEHLDTAVVHIQPTAGDQFGSSTSVVVTIDVAAGAHMVEIGPIDVGGLARRDIAEFSTTDGQLAVTARGVSASVRLDPLGEAGRAALVSLLGVQRVSATSILNLAIVIDGSLSFRRFVASGDVIRLVSILSGLASVMGSDSPVRLALSGLRPIVEMVEDSEHLAPRATALTHGRMVNTGARLDTLELYESSPNVNTVFWVLTDAVPAEIDRLTMIGDVAGKAVHIVVLGEELPGSSSVGGLPITMVETSVLADNGASRDLRGLVRDLVQGCFVPGTAEYERTKG